MSPSSSNPRKSAAYHHGDLKRGLVAAGRLLLEDQGVDRLSLRAVARAAGVSQAAPYHHFADKDALLAAIAAEGFAGLSAEMAARAQGAAGSSDYMRGLGAGYVVFAFKNPALFRLMHGPRFTVSAKYDELLVVAAQSYQMLRDGVSACLPGAAAAQIETACQAAWSLVHGASMLIVDGRLDAGDTVDDIAAFADRMTAQLPLRAADD